MKLRNGLWLIPALVVVSSIPGRISPRVSLAHSLADATNFYNVKTFGAKADGQTLDTPAINRAIDSAAAAGGGTVYFPAGNTFPFRFISRAISRFISTRSPRSLRP